MIYCDRFKWKGKTVGHLISDQSHEELHQFAGKIGLKPEWFQIKGNHNFSHYDLTTENAINRAIKAGAVLIKPVELVKKLTELNLKASD